MSLRVVRTPNTLRTLRGLAFKKNLKSGKIQGLGTCLFSVMENPIEFHYSKIQLSSDERDYLRGDNARVTGGMMTKIDDLSRSSSV